nr:hypothetical protein [Tanacetum cinerariifolium]
MRRLPYRPLSRSHHHYHPHTYLTLSSWMSREGPRGRGACYYADEHEEEDPEEEDLKEEDPEEKESDDNAASKEEPSEGFDDTEPSKKDETAVTPSLSRLHEIPSPPPMPSSPLPPVPVETHAPEQDVVAALLMLPSTTRRSEVLEADMSPQKRLCFATPKTRFEVGESLAVAATRPPRDIYSFVDNTKAEASITHMHVMTLHDTKRMMMTAIELVNLRVIYEAQTRQRDGEEFHSQLRDTQRDRADIRAEIVALRDRVALIGTIETRMTDIEDQFQDTRDHAVSHVVLEARAHIDTIKDAGSSS